MEKINETIENKTIENPEEFIANENKIVDTCVNCDTQKYDTPSVDNPEEVIKIPFFKISDLAIELKYPTNQYLKKLKISFIIFLCIFIIGIIGAVLMCTYFPQHLFANFHFEAYLHIIGIFMCFATCLFTICFAIFHFILIKKINNSDNELFYPIYSSESCLTIVTHKNVFSISSHIPCPVCMSNSRFYFQKSQNRDICLIICDYAGDNKLHMFAIKLHDLKKHIQEYKGVENA